MERYQVRLYKKSIQELFDEIGHRVAAVVAPELGGARQTEDRVRAAVSSAISLHLHRFNTCGTEIFCDECAVFRPLMSKGTQEGEFEVNLREDADRYQLLLPQDLWAFLDELTSSVWQTLLREEITHEVAPSTETRRKITRAIRDGLAPYVYFNTECGHRNVCGRARDLPITVE
jgi:hypothetical protein